MNKFKSIKWKISRTIFLVPFLIIVVFFFIELHVIDKSSENFSRDMLEKLNAGYKSYELNSKNQYREQTEKISQNANLIVPLYYGVYYQVHDALKNFEIKEELEHIVVLSEEMKPLVSSKSTVDFEKETKYFDFIKFRYNEPFIWSDNSSIFISNIIPLEYKNKFLGRLVITKKLSIRDFPIPCALIVNNFAEAVSDSYNSILQSSSINIPKMFSKTGNLFKYGKYFYSVDNLLDYNDEVIGKIVIFVDFSEYHHIQNSLFITSIIIMLLLIAVIVAVSFFLSSSISEPIINLASVSKSIAEGSIQNIRYSSHKEDEIGLLYRNFNIMVNELLRTQQELENSKDILEFVVAERTKDLQITNESLQKEIEIRKSAEQNLMESEQQYRNLVEGSLEGIFIVQNDKIVFSNNTICRMFDINKSSTDDIWIQEIIGEKIWSNIKSYSESGGPDESNEYSFELNRNIDEKHFYEALGHKITFRNSAAFHVVIRDVTKSAMLEQHVKQSQKMEAIGNLAGGVAHDFNNLLTIINGYSEILLQNSSVPENIRNIIVEISDAGNKASFLTRQLLAFSRKEIMHPVVVDINDVLQNMFKMLRRLVPEDIDIEMNLQQNLHNVEADPGQLEQIFINLIVNAKDAIQEKELFNRRRLIQIETDELLVCKEFNPEFSNLEDGLYLMIIVKDNGKGIPENIRDKIFEPFFTSRKENNGTGLGLSTIYGIVKQNMGYISVESEVNVGTEFKILWPVKEVSEVAVQDKERSIVQGNKELILIVEDDEAVMDITKQILLSANYNIITAINGNEALKKLLTLGKDVDLILTDVIMPEMDGGTLSSIVRDKYPHIKILFGSGYTDDVLKSKGISSEGMNFVAKPYTHYKLTSIVRQLLEEQNRS